jgi:hypothetical protein
VSTDNPEDVGYWLAMLRKDAREKVARELDRQVSLSGGYGTFRMLAHFERVATEGYAGALHNAAGFLLAAKGGAASLARTADTLAIDIVAELERRRLPGRVRIADVVFDEHIRRTREAMANARRIIVEEFHHGFVEGRL